MSQTSITFFYILAGFVIYVTAKGELPSYLNLALGKSSNGSAAGSNQQASDSGGIGQALQTASLAAITLA